MNTTTMTELEPVNRMVPIDTGADGGSLVDTAEQLSGMSVLLTALVQEYCLRPGRLKDRSLALALTTLATQLDVATQQLASQVAKLGDAGRRDLG